MARRKHDFYPTPSWATEKLLERVRLPGVIGEPCVGAGDVANVIRRRSPGGQLSRSNRSGKLGEIAKVQMN